MKITVTKIVFLALTLILIPSTTAAKGSRGDREYRGDKEHHEEKGQREDDDNRGEKRRHEVEKYRGDKEDDEDRREHGRRFLNKLRLQNSACKDVDGRKARWLCYAYCEVLKCDRAPNSEGNFCQRLYRNYERITDGGTPPCVAVTAVSCPCYGDLDTVFNGTSPTCSPAKEPTLVFDSNSTTQVQASVDPRFLACIGENGITTLDKLEEASSCLNMIREFCSAL